jgi:hypothetical protein
MKALAATSVFAVVVLSCLALAAAPQAAVPRSAVRQAAVPVAAAPEAAVPAGPSNTKAIDQASEVPELLTPPITYVLSGENWALHGCWQPCMCPLLVEGDMVGQLTLQPTQQSPELTTYAVTGVAWDVFDHETAEHLYTVTGSGTYEVRTLPDGSQTQHMILDLVYDEFASEFDSGEVPIDAGQPLTVLIADSQAECLKDAFLVQAVPVALLDRVAEDE